MGAAAIDLKPVPWELELKASLIECQYTDEYWLCIANRVAEATRFGQLSALHVWH